MKLLDVTLQPRKEEKPEVKVEKPRYNWFYENSINSGKTPINLDEPQEFSYNKWRTNSSLSNHKDTILWANEMNLNSHISDKLHYECLFYAIRKATRYGKKKTDQDKRLEKQLEQELELIHLIQRYYKYNITKAKEVLKILSTDQIELIRKKEEKGGFK